MSNPENKTTSKRETREEILSLSVILFARQGFDGVSMRDVAQAVGLTQAALYYHFPDKEHLYLHAFAHEYRKREARLKEILDSRGPPWERLEAFVSGMAQMISADRTFLRLMQWALLDNDDARRSKLAAFLFKDMMFAVHDLAGKLAPDRDAHLLTISIFGLVAFHFQSEAVNQFVPGYTARNINPEFLARHVCELLRHGLVASEEDSNPFREQELAYRNFQTPFTQGVPYEQK